MEREGCSKSRAGPAVLCLAMAGCLVALAASPAWGQGARRPAGTMPPAPQRRPAPRPPAGSPPPAPAPTPAPAAPPAAAHFPPGTVPTVEDVSAAIGRGVGWLYSKQSPDGSWPSRHGRQHPGGPESLVVLAALWAGEDANRPEIRKALEYIRRMAPQTVYARSMRALVFARLAGERGGGGPVEADALRRLNEDAAWLVKAQDKQLGGWGYGFGHPTTVQSPGWLDCSNSLMATMALDEAADAGAAVPASVWVKTKAFWVASQNEDGGWGYQSSRDKSLRLRGSSYGSMTAGGLASGLAAMKHDAPSLDTMAGMPFAGPRSADGADQRMVDSALAWLAGNHASDRVPKWVWGGEDWLFFYQWHLARAAGLAGLRAIGPQDWWAQLAACDLALQRPDGSWAAAQDSGKDDSKDPVSRTAMAVLALAEGRRPVAIGKLALEGRWGGAHRDAANVSRWLGTVLGEPVGWQLLDANASHRAMAEAPILYFDVPEHMEFSQEQFAELLAFLRQGGTLVVQCPPQDPNFAAQVATYLRAGLRGLRGEPLKAEHPVFHARFTTPAAEGYALGDDLRTRAFLFVTDISGPAHRGAGKEAVAAYQLWANLLEYATDGEPLRGKLSFRRPPAGPVETGRSVQIGRLRHKGEWDVCPGAVKRLSEVLAAAVSAGAGEQAVEAAQAASCKAPLLWLAGTTEPLDFSQQELSQIKKYVELGGTLFIDSALGNEAVLQSARKLAKDISGQDAQELPPDHPLLSGKFAGGAGCDVSTVSWSRAGARKFGAPRGKPGLLGVAMNGRAAIVISPVPLTCPLEGLPTYGLVSLAVPDARRLAANLVLYTTFKPE